MLQLTADGSIPKMHGDAERGSLQLQFIIIPLGSIGKTLLLVQRVMQQLQAQSSSTKCKCSPVFHVKILHPFNSVNLVT